MIENDVKKLRNLSVEYENHSNLVNQARSEAEKCIQMIKNRIEYIKSTEEEKYFKWKEELSDFCDRMKKIEVKLYRVSTFDNEKNREVVKKELNDLLERVPLTPEEERKRREEDERKRREEEERKRREKEERKRGEEDERKRGEEEERKRREEDERKRREEEERKKIFVQVIFILQLRL